MQLSALIEKKNARNLRKLNFSSKQLETQKQQN